MPHPGFAFKEQEPKKPGSLNKLCCGSVHGLFKTQSRRDGKPHFRSVVGKSLLNPAAHLPRRQSCSCAVLIAYLRYPFVTCHHSWESACLSGKRLQWRISLQLEAVSETSSQQKSSVHQNFDRRWHMVASLQTDAGISVDVCAARALVTSSGQGHRGSRD